MSWFKVDDAFYLHPKVASAGNAAIGLWLRCGAYCAHHLTDGFVPRDVAYSFGTKALCIRLVEVGMWTPAEGGWRMHDYLDYQPNRDEVMELRRKRAEAGRRGGSKSGRKGGANGQASA